MSTQNKEIVVIDPQLVSGSGDTMRDALGLSIDGSSDTFYLSAIPFDKTSPTSEEDGLINKYTYYYRIFGNSDNILSDKHWKSYVIGGEFSDATLSGIYSETGFSDHYHSEIVPYSLLETKANGLFETTSPDYISVQPVMNDYHRNYVDYANNVGSVTDIPNSYYLIKNVILPLPLRPSLMAEKKKEIDNIFNFQIPNGTFVSQQTGTLQQNLLFVDQGAFDEIITLNSGETQIPQFVKTKFDFERTGQFVKDCVSNGFQYLFMRSLKETFLQQDGAPSLSDVSFTVDSSIIDADGNTLDASTSTTLPVVDVFDMMNYCLENYNTETQDFEFLLDHSEQARAEYDTKSIRRLEKTIPTLRQFQSLNNLLESSIYLNTFVNSPISVREKINEVIAYRVEKIFGSETVQNFWFLNLEDVSNIDFNDNQIAYGQDYTYNIYKYVLVAGTSYEYSNIRLSRVLGRNLSLWGLEIYDPATDEAIEPLFPSSLIINDLSTGAQIQSRHRYVADFQLDVMPSIKIVEVQMFSKEVSILDAPTNYTSVIPGYVTDNSQRLIFEVRHDLVANSPFPTTMNSEEEDYKNKFLNSYDLLEGEEFMLETKSLASTIQVYRIDFKPTSITDFDQKLIMTETLKMVNQNEVFSNKMIHNRVATNKKYYYYIRVLNDAGSPARGSRIIEAEMIDDGGYKFAIFKVYFEEELEVKPFNRPIESFKKLLNIVPNIENVIVNSENVDYSDTSDNQIGNVKFGQSDDPVWDKTFKIRLTSKKTGKKIDINLTHKLV